MCENVRKALSDPSAAHIHPAGDRDDDGVELAASAVLAQVQHELQAVANLWSVIDSGDELSEDDLRRLSDLPRLTGELELARTLALVPLIVLGGDRYAKGVELDAASGTVVLTQCVGRGRLGIGRHGLHSWTDERGGRGAGEPPVIVQTGLGPVKFHPGGCLRVFEDSSRACAWPRWCKQCRASKPERDQARWIKRLADEISHGITRPSTLVRLGIRGGKSTGEGAPS